MIAKCRYRLQIRNAKPAMKQQQGGVVLFFALIALVALMLAAIALVRSVDTANAIAGNVAFKQGTIQEADSGVEAAFKALTVPTIIDKTQDDLERYYYATYDPAVAVPGARLDAASDTVGAASGNKVRYVIERMCLNAGAVDPANCLQPPVTGNSSKASGQTVFVEDKVYYRVTVRISGPRNTSSTVQVILAV